ncbi:MAG TPA: deoxyguanosinetriphosphate triphosphohydrolase [Caulobacterales bacterium]|nr:deoxyguanosinetriphosphate triphosphohydrolase [Caulobacterales bacterium]
MNQPATKYTDPPPWAAPPRARWATDPARSRGRLYPEPESATRSPFQRDRDRIIHTQAFRRLKQKTQVFVAHEGDHYRTRLTHSLEVAQVARAAARTLGLDEDLAEAIALAHDLGHPPFGHAGERELDACMADHGGFDHNAQTLRVLTKLEERFPAFDGLNLAWETLEGVVKHNGPLLRPGRSLSDLPAALQAYAAQQDLELETWSGPEAQIAALADDIAYNNHDIDDGWRAGLFRLDDLLDVPFVEGVLRGVLDDYPGLSEFRVAAELIRRLIGARIADLVGETQRRAGRLKPASAEDVRAAGEAIVAFSDEMRDHEAALRRFLRERMYRHTRVNRMMSQARRLVRELFRLFLAEPEVLPEAWCARTHGAGDSRTARVVCDYIAGMTDAYAIEEHRRLFNLDRWA